MPHASRLPCLDRRNVIGDTRKSRRSSLLNYLRLPDTSTFLDLNILPRTLFLNSLTLCEKENAGTKLHSIRFQADS